MWEHWPSHRQDKYTRLPLKYLILPDWEIQHNKAFHWATHTQTHTHRCTLHFLEQWLWLWQCYEDRFLCIHFQTSKDCFYNKIYCLHVLYSYIHMFTILLTSSQEQVFGRSSQVNISVPHLVLFSHLSHIEWRYWRLTARTRWLLAVQGLWLVHN